MTQRVVVSHVVGLSRKYDALLFSAASVNWYLLFVRVPAGGKQEPSGPGVGGTNIVGLIIHSSAPEMLPILKVRKHLVSPSADASDYRYACD